MTFYILFKLGLQQQHIFLVHRKFYKNYNSIDLLQIAYHKIFMGFE
jgi:hypothetical protein